MNTTVNNRLLNRFQAFLTTHNQLTQRQYEISLQGNRIIIIRIIHIDVHRIDILGTGRTDFDDLTAKSFHQSTILCLRI